MDTIVVLRKLREIEEAIGNDGNPRLRALIELARNCTIQIQNDTAEVVRNP